MARKDNSRKNARKKEARLVIRNHKAVNKVKETFDGDKLKKRLHMRKKKDATNRKRRKNIQKQVSNEQTNNPRNNNNVIKSVAANLIG